MRKGKLLLCILVSVMMVMSLSSSCFADETSTPELTLQQAVDRALVLSKSLKTAEIQKEKAKEQRGDAQDAVNYTPIGMVNDQIASAYVSLLQAELNYQIKNRSAEALQDDIRAEVMEKYCGVLSAEAANASAILGLKEAEWQYTAAMAKLRVGMLPPASQVAVEAQLEAAKSTLSTSQKSLDKAYVELNSLVGYAPEFRARLVTEIPYENIQVDSITAEVNRALSNSTDVWAALQNVTIERQDLRFSSNAALGIQSYDIEKLEIEIAQLTADEAEDALEEALVLLYHDILTLEGGIQAAQQGVAAAEQALATAQLRFDVGMATQGDIISAQAGLENARNTLAGLKYSHATALSAFRNLTGRDVLPVIPGEGAQNSL